MEPNRLKEESLSHEYLKRILDYNPDTGEFRWKEKIARCIRVGNVAGNMEMSGYYRITIHGNPFPSHRLAWFYYYGKWPTQIIDHINRIKSDNRIVNLRDCSMRDNSHNSSTTNDYYVGTHPSARGKWAAAIHVEQRRIHLGVFNDREDARNKYLEALDKLLKEGSNSDYFKSYTTKRRESGLAKGVRAYGNSWRATYCLYGKQHHIGTFRTKEEAELAYEEAVARANISGECFLVWLNERKQKKEKV